MKSFLLALLLMLAVVAAGGCSHTTPYVRDDVIQSHAAPETEALRHRLILIGDAGKPRTQPGGKSDPVLAALTRTAGRLPQKTAVVFIGDNVYEEGIPAESDSRRYAAAVGYLEAQIDVLRRSGARGYFVPGNHDWHSGHVGGYAAVLRQEGIIAARTAGAAEMLPGSGCPGPVKIDFAGVRMIVVDTQWWLHPAADRGEAACWPADAGLSGAEKTAAMAAAFSDSLAAMVASAGSREVVVIAHHPLKSRGHHGGFYDWKMYVLPFPLVLPFAKGVLKIGGHQDLSGRDYRRMTALFTRAVEKSRRPLLLASGHEHNLQVMEGDPWAEFILISGAGSQGKITSVSHGPETLFALSQTGFMLIDFTMDGRSFLRVYSVDKKSGVESVVFNLRLR